MVRATGLEPVRTRQDAATLEVAVSAFPPRPRKHLEGSNSFECSPSCVVVVLGSRSLGLHSTDPHDFTARNSPGSSDSDATEGFVPKHLSDCVVVHLRLCSSLVDREC
jgi:hypothetical protein